MTATTYYAGTPGTYKVWLTPEGWAVVYLISDTEYRDTGKIYASRNSASSAASRLNHPVRNAVKKTGICEGYWDGYTLVVAETESDCGMYDDGESWETKGGYTLYIKVGDMPSHFSKTFDTVEEVETYINRESAFPLNCGWHSVEGE